MREIAPEEQFLPLFTIFYYLMLDFYVKTWIRFSLRDKRLFEITEVEITRVDYICFPTFYHIYDSEFVIRPLFIYKLGGCSAVYNDFYLDVFTAGGTMVLLCCVLRNGVFALLSSVLELQSNFSGSNTFGTMKISSRQG